MGHRAFQAQLDVLVEQSKVAQEVFGAVMARASLRAPDEISRSDMEEGDQAAGRWLDQRRLPQATVSKAVKALVAAGLLENGETLLLSKKDGRPLSPLRLGRQVVIAGVHVAQRGWEPTTVTSALVGLDTSRVLAHRTDTVENVEGNEWRTVATLVHSQVCALKRDLDESLAGDGLPPVRLFGIGVEVGAPTYDGQITPVPGVYPHMSVDFDSMLRVLFDDDPLFDEAVPVVVENDVNALAVLATHEAHYADPDLVVISVFDEGIGGGLVMDGRLRRGSDGSSMEIGHLTVGYAPGNDPLDVEALAGVGFGVPERCDCGRYGHVDTIATPTRIRRELEIDDLSEAANMPAHDGNSEKRDLVFARAGSVLGRAVAHVCNVVNPSRLIIFAPACLAEPSPGTSGAAYRSAAETEIEEAFAVAGKPLGDFLKFRELPDSATEIAILGARAAAVCVLETFIEHAFKLDACERPERSPASKTA